MTNTSMQLQHGSAPIKRIPSNNTDTTVNTTISEYDDALQNIPTDMESRDFTMAKRVRDSEIIGNKSNLNPLQAPFAYIDGSMTINEEVHLVANNIKNLLHKDHKTIEDTGLTESVDKKKMAIVEEKIRKLENIDNLNIDHNEEKENKLIMDLRHNTEPITLPNRNTTWQHNSKEKFIERVNLKTIPTPLSNDNINEFSAPSSNHMTLKTDIQLPNNPPFLSDSNVTNIESVTFKDPKTVLDEKNDKKTAFMVDSFLLGYADMLCLTSSFLKDENGAKKGPLLTPLLSLCITDITNDVFLSRLKSNHGQDNLMSNLNKDDLLKLATFSKNRMFKLHLEYGVGDHVLRWDMEKDTKSLMVLHKKLIKKNTKERLDRIRRREFDVPRFPVLPSHFAKFRGLFKGDREVLIVGEKKNSDGRKKSSGNFSTNEPLSSSLNRTSPSNDIPRSIPVVLESNALDAAESIAESTHSIAHTLTKFSTAALGTLLQHKDKDRAEKTKEKEDKEKDKQREKERNKFVMDERIRLNQKYRDDMQAYFDLLLENVAFREQSDKVLQFFELSPFSLLLSNEIYKKRKEGYMFVVSSASKQGWRVSHFRFHDMGEMIKRHTSKWCILGDSFLIYTSDIISTTPEEVFLLDSKIQMSIHGFSERNNNNDDDDDNESDNYNYYNYNLNDNINDNDDIDDNYFANPNEVLKSAKSYPTIKLKNSERSIKLVATNPKITRQWAASIRMIMNETEWAKPHRFESFAPVRHDAFAQWFVDARDYWYAASSAIEMAKDVIYIHDWWLSPELYLRRPANGNQNWRIDRLLERKAKQGVKIFVIIYRNVGNTVVTDSMYTKHSLLDLHENIYVLRSPNQIMQNVFFWAHHEKLLIIDHSICFLGGIDLCFGRYDTPDHVLVDDSKYAFQLEATNELSTTSTPSSNKNNKNLLKTLDSGTPSKIPDKVLNRNGLPNSPNSPNSYTNSEPSFQEKFQIFPGKDYSNPRKKDFFELTSPHEDMYDRQTIPRMPWHDVHMVTSGQVARDLSRHFIQRWNYLLRQKRPSRPTPLLLPPKPFTDEELSNLNLKGNCEIQLLRSSGDWSLGLKEHEQSIQNAYVKCIEQSEHFVYIENQFFITSCTVENAAVKNHIGDALVDRIITAHKNGEVWKAVIVIPLMPGFEADVDTKEGGSVRLIMQCQYMSISMGETSIFARLRRVGIRPEDYINFYSLRKWGLIGDKKLLTTEQLYIHAKTMIVDDRIAIIGSANINERSMRGTRDSEVCAIVRDKDLIESKMDGKLYHVGKFSHSLRVRLMREHLGIDVDLIDLVERRFSEIEKFCHTDIGVRASVLRPNEGKLSLSAMVEMGTRYLLGLSNGTPGFCQRNDTTNENCGKELTEVMISKFTCIKNESDDSKALDDIEFSFSFNHRAGNENAGIRSAKNFSSDTRVQNDNHRNEVKGDFDGFNSKYFSEAKIQLNKFLHQKVNQCIQPITEQDTNDKNYPLPDFEDIVDVLSQHIIADASVGDQNAINIDRWTMIKRLFYMRKLYSKMVNNESKRSNESTSNSEDKTIKNINHSTINGKDIGNVYGENNNITAEIADDISPITPTITIPTSHIQAEYTGTDSTPIEGMKNDTIDIPLMKLSNDDINDIDKNMLPQLNYEFLDPYGFEDPLDISFYEGTWMSQAVRNTLLFQMVFHVQPDDAVQTWKDYKEFEELKNAFEVYQNIYKGQNVGESGIINRNENNNYASEGDSINFYPNATDDDIEEHRRRLKRSAKLAELERFQRNAGAFDAIAGANGYGRGTVYDHNSSLRLMNMVRGHIVVFPTRWLKKEVEGSNWFYKADKIPPIQIYD